MPKIRTAFFVGILAGLFISCAIATGTGAWMFATETFFWTFFFAPVALLGVACAALTLWIGVLCRILSFIRQNVWRPAVQAA